MIRLLANWVLCATALLIVAHIAPGFYVAGFGAAMAAALVIGLINATLGFFLKIVTAPISLLTFGVFLLVINALMLMLASSLLRGFEVRGFGAAFVGAVALALVNMGLRWFLRKAQEPPRPAKG
jgi:putative membrane protein